MKRTRIHRVLAGAIREAELMALARLLALRCRPDDAVVLTGCPRSGTTWLGQILTELRGALPLFEPLQLDKVPEARRAGFSWRTFVPADASWPAGEDFLLRVFEGKVVNAWTAQEMSIKRAAMASFLVVKFVRANRMLSWLCRRFPVRAVLLIRHPCAVVASQIQGGWTQTPKLNARRLFAAYPGLEPIMQRLGTQEELLAAIWALDNLVPLASSASSAWQLVPYEQLVLDYEGTLRRLFGAWGLVVPSGAAALRTLPSSMTHRSGMAGIDGWRRKLKPEAIERILRVVSSFGLDFYGEESEPDYRRLRDPDLALRLQRMRRC